MKLNFGAATSIGIGAEAYMVHSPDNQVVLFFKDGDQILKKSQTTVVLGNWSGLVWGLPSQTFPQTVNKQHIHYVARRFTFNGIITSNANKILYSSYSWADGVFSKFKPVR